MLCGCSIVWSSTLENINFFVAMRNLMEGSLLVLCWCGESTVGFMEVQGLWVVMDLQWSSRVARCSWICEGRRSWCWHGPVSDVWCRFDLCESRFAACAWRKCSAIYRSTSIRVNGGATLTGVASVSSEGGGCEVQMFNLWPFAMFCGFASWVVTWFRRRVYGVYTRVLTNIYVRCVVIIHRH